MVFRSVFQNIIKKSFSTKSTQKSTPIRKTVVAFSIAVPPVTCYGAYRLYKTDSDLMNKIIDFYEHLPFNALSRFDGKLASLTIPNILRKPIYLCYSYIFKVNLEEMENPNLENYSCLCEFFCRRIDLRYRPIDVHATLTSPADGKILYLDKVIDGNLQQVKGIPFTLNKFLCLSRLQTNSASNEDENNYLPQISPQSNLYFCTIYLAPGDYHCFHSPANWNIVARRYVPGRLMSVNPVVSRRVKDLFVCNERVAYFGRWKHGFFCYSAIGATNVGNIRVYSDTCLATNLKENNTPYQDQAFTNNLSRKGEIFGDFRLGSTILLIFEAPADFEFCVKPGDYVKVGQALSKY